ncbi:Phosphopantetheine adenylyltransferase OS=Tsukamurella paurometabola (strain ATCC 8368 / DSM/ CCUG 35730 / CIP 100753 / JCM 10117 / KCTC 9821 / NBRC 16120/ NCIMB 702349 / NCTC 13040) OX=521096 GN=coaD PE=3 SV=1 [Tsukamurella paurometabola]|uniref:Phosphopantetheine adenylyltransferase n=1 Tax=Tsukamurella paurometabola (strain ATCC 8368 / DSM 20162 / CCUG 35730 / CIP 100753 / JCM 10117 / KCTC 9821 / NBRC 16120 / NCIMB 702349 / NCTC 13040) TaxID=521096 RepID=D5UY78_TSUPD|nr:pantetheine-phosphate adenylyltransferase [Tsukamurella paurometabola]ADG78185.1 pantetheine-phosphate adenylyltransferase [Tsukamurella paurometabola DSM 20162]SUP30584.1 Phosphopantetheine adenylyltransferase [Tsukamurella paurometabola]
MSKACCPGSFDPMTNGHLDIFRRAAKLFDELVVTVVVNPNKQGMFTIDERIALIEENVADLPGVSVERWEGLLVDYARDRGMACIVKGLRNSTDFDYELPMAGMNQHLTGVETAFLTTSPQYSYVSSSLVKEVAKLGGDISALIPPNVQDAVRAKLS